jgi:ankyrin repeat protein
MKQLLITIAALLFVGCGNPEADSALFDAVSNGNTEDTKKLIADGADVDAKDDRFLGQTPLHPAAWKGYKEIVELLIAAGADVNAKGYFSETPLSFAAEYGHKEIVELLIAAGADVNVHDTKAKRTPLDDAIRPENSNNTDETAALLRKHGGKTYEELKAEGK